MEKFTASEVCSAIGALEARDMEYEAGMLHAFADLLEAREKAVPVAWMHPDLHDGHPYPEECLNQEKIEGWLPLYTHPAPSDAGRLAEALERTARHRAAADGIDPDQWRSVLYGWEDRALAAPSAQPQPQENPNG